MKKLFFTIEKAVNESYGKEIFKTLSAMKKLFFWLPLFLGVLVIEAIISWLGAPSWYSWF